jgi:hypothetical protein
MLTNRRQESHLREVRRLCELHRALEACRYSAAVDVAMEITDALPAQRRTTARVSGREPLDAGGTHRPQLALDVTGLAFGYLRTTALPEAS